MKRRAGTSYLATKARLARAAKCYKACEGIPDAELERLTNLKGMLEFLNRAGRGSVRAQDVLAVLYGSES